MGPKTLELAVWKIQAPFVGEITSLDWPCCCGENSKGRPGPIGAPGDSWWRYGVSIALLMLVVAVVFAANATTASNPLPGIEAFFAGGR